MILNKKTLYIILVLIAVVVGYVVCLFTQKKHNTVGKSTTDTTTIIHIDTFIDSKPIFIKSKVLDTIWLKCPVKPNSNCQIGAINPKDTTEYLLVTQKKYEDSTYTAYVSGVNPNLDSIRTYSKNITTVITNTNEKITYKNSNARFYLIGGVDKINNNYYPNIGVGISFPQRLFISGKIGVYENKQYYGVNIGWQIK